MPRASAVVLCLTAGLLLPASFMHAQNLTDPLPQRIVAASIDSGQVRNNGQQRGVIYSTIVHAPDSPWIRLSFAEATLGRTPIGGQPTMLRITSLLDGAVQTMHGVHLKQWQNTTAYFNGDAVLVEIIADPGAPASRIAINQLWAGVIVDGGVASICGPTDDRTLSNDPRAARILPVGCTGWLISDAEHCMLTAGHCAGSGLQTIQFNVPLSTGSGGLQHPGPEDQYAVDPTSKQSTNGGVGNDWGYYGCFPNSTTGLTMFEAQQAAYELANAAPQVNGQTIRITGYGVDSSPPQSNQVQQTHAGPYTQLSGNAVRYQADTTGGNSGSAVFDESTQLAIGIHTHAGCNSGGGSNQGTAIHHPALQNALANPNGICIPSASLQFVFPDDIPELLNPAGDSIRVVVQGSGGGVPLEGSGMLHYDIGAGLVSVPMSQVSPNVYDAIFPAMPCGGDVLFYFSAQTTKGEMLYHPELAPNMMHHADAAVAVQVVASNDFNQNTGWTVVNSDGLTAGAWAIAAPANSVPSAPTSDADGSGRCFLTGPTFSDGDVDGGSTTAISPVFDASAQGSVISYFRWFATDPSTEDSMVVEVSDDNGATWVTLETLEGGEGGWIHKSWRIADIAGIDNTNQFRIRFTATDGGDDSTVEAGLDGFELIAYDCGSSTTCPTDINGSGAVDIEDLLAVINAYGSTGSNPADVNGSGSVDVEDLLAVINAWGKCS